METQVIPPWKLYVPLRSLSHYVSEPDKGIYDAMNKGIALATGDVIGTLNADDFYMHDQVLADVAHIFLDPTIEACYGDLVYVKQDDINQIVRYWKSKRLQIWHV